MFSILAGAMLLAALSFVLLPLLRARGVDAASRHKRDALEQARRAGVLSDDEVQRKLAALSSDDPPAHTQSRALPAVLALLIPLAAITLYRQIGEPRALDSIWQGAVAAANGTPAAPDDSSAQGPDMEQAVAGLAERLRLQPDDLEGWMLLGRAYKTTERFEPAREALANAYRLAPENPDVLVEYAEAMVLASKSRRFEGESRELLERAVLLQPDSQRGLWLFGIAAYQDENYADASKVWERLLASIPADAEARDALVERIADARQRAGLEPMASPAPPVAASTTEAPATTPSSTPSDVSATTRLTVTVDLAPELKAKVGASDVLFVFARAASGPRMPLAIQRLSAGSLPVTVTLDDSTSMMPTMKLSLIPQVVVGARISKSGQATPQPGDFETVSAPIANTHSEPLHLIIDKVVP